MAKIDKLIAQAANHLESGEEIRASVLGAYETKIMGSDSVRQGTFIATDRRLVFFAKKLGGYDFESFPYENISSFEEGKSMLGHTMSLFASGNKVSMKYIKSGEDFRTFVGVVRNSMGKRQALLPTAPDSVGSKTPDVMSQLKQLGELRDAGVLTEEEFQAKKTDLLGRL